MTDNHLLAAAPVLFLCMIFLRSMDIRKFMAGITGFITPYIIIAGYFIFENRTDEIPSMVKDFLTINILSYKNIDTIQWICLSAIFLIFITSVIFAEKILHQDKVKNRSIIKGMNFTGIYLFVIMLMVPSTSIALIPVMILITSILFGYVMTMLYNKATLIMMTATLIITFGIAGYNLLFA